MLTSPSRMFAVLAVVAVALAHPLCADSLVLCVGSDGHLELEPSVDGSCADTRAAQAGETKPASTVDSGTEDHCGQCVDLPIVHSAPDIYSVSYSVRVMAPFAVVVSPMAILSDTENFIVALSATASDFEAFFASLRSVSLRI